MLFVGLKEEGGGGWGDFFKLIEILMLCKKKIMIICFGLYM